MAKKGVKKVKLDPNDPMTPVKLFMQEVEALDRRAVEVTRLAHSRGAKAEEIAEVMKVSRRTVYNRLDGYTPNGNKVAQ